MHPLREILDAVFYVVRGGCEGVGEGSYAEQGVSVQKGWLEVQEEKTYG